MNNMDKLRGKIDYNYEYRNFLKICSHIPEYIKRNLRKMPNNKGYIWKGVSLFGELPPEEETTILFENMGHELMKIHETTSKEYKIYEKKGKEKRILIHKEKKREKKLDS